jgi:hypothetical protein
MLYVVLRLNTLKIGSTSLLCLHFILSVERTQNSDVIQKWRSFKVIDYTNSKLQSTKAAPCYLLT